MKQVSVKVSGVDFSAGHFVSEGGKCERLHGHNYQVMIHIVGELNSQGMVMDFRVVKERLRKLCKAWDHRLLLPSRSQNIKIITKGEQTKVITPERNYVIPSQDVEILDVVETTAEELARVLCEAFIKNLKTEFSNVSEVSVSVAESNQQMATVTITL